MEGKEKKSRRAEDKKVEKLGVAVLGRLGADEPRIFIDFFYFLVLTP